MKIALPVILATAMCPVLAAEAHAASDITVKDLKRYYHQIVYTTGAQTDRYLTFQELI